MSGKTDETILYERELFFVRRNRRGLCPSERGTPPGYAHGGFRRVRFPQMLSGVPDRLPRGLYNVGQHVGAQSRGKRRRLFGQTNRRARRQGRSAAVPQGAFQGFPLPPPERDIRPSERLSLRGGGDRRARAALPRPPARPHPRQRGGAGFSLPARSAGADGVCARLRSGGEGDVCRARGHPRHLPRQRGKSRAGGLFRRFGGAHPPLRRGDGGEAERDGPAGHSRRLRRLCGRGGQRARRKGAERRSEKFPHHGGVHPRRRHRGRTSVRPDVVQSLPDAPPEKFRRFLFRASGKRRAGVRRRKGAPGQIRRAL